MVVLNPSAGPVTLYSKQHVGRLHCVAEVDGISADTESGDVVHAPISRILKSWFQAPLSTWLIKLLPLIGGSCKNCCIVFPSDFSW